MNFRRNSDSGKHSSAILASSFVFAGGLMACAMIVFLFSSDSRKPLLLCALGLLVPGLFLWLLRDKPPREARTRHFYWLTRTKPEDYFPKYVPKRRRSRKTEVFGINEPPTAESLRDLQDNANTWVPREPPSEQ
jgi:hypothetical protein